MRGRGGEGRGIFFEEGEVPRVMGSGGEEAMGKELTQGEDEGGKKA